MPEVITISVTETPEVVTIDVVEAVATVVNSDRTYTLLAPARRESVLPDVEHTDTGGDKVTLPAMTPMVCTPASCSGVDVKNSDDTYSQHVNDGDPLTLPDTVVKNTAGTTVLTQPSCTNTGVVADCRVVNSNLSYDELVPAETTHNLADVPNVDSNGDIVMTPAMTPFVATPAVQTYASAKLMQTGQTTSYRAGDYITAGREVNFFTLKENNPFGNANRFTDELGGATYTNNIVIDWSTFDGLSVLGYYRTLIANNTWENVIDACVALSVGSFNSGWRLVNRTELNNIVNGSVLHAINYAPFNIDTNTHNIWMNMTMNTYPTYSKVMHQYGDFIYKIKSDMSIYGIAVRTFSVSGTTLT